MTQTYTKPIRYLLLPLMATAALWSAAPFDGNFCQKPELNIPERECEALHDLWDTAGGTGWTHQDGWGVDTNASNWYGITLTDDSTDGKKSVYKINLRLNNLTDTLPESINRLDQLYDLRVSRNHLDPFPDLNLTHLEILLARTNHTHNPFPDLSGCTRLKIANFAENDFNGTWSSCAWLPGNIEDIDLAFNNFVGSVPSCLNKFDQIDALRLNDNNFSGPLPDLSGLTRLDLIYLEHNQFTFADYEPRIEWLNSVREASYGWQRGHYHGVGRYYDVEYDDPREVCHDYYTDERDHVVYFDHTLRIEPRVPANTYSDHDYFDWFKENGTTEGQRLDNGGRRIYLKEDANATDEGYYYYEANNSVVTQPRLYYTDMHFCSSPYQDGIHAIHDAAPHWGNAALPEGVATVGVAYRYASGFSDADDDAEDLHVSLEGNAGWLHLAVDGDTFTLSGTPQDTDAGRDYPLTLTLTDGKITQERRWILHVNTADLPEGITQTGETYTHDATHTAIQAPNAWLETPADDTLGFTYPCEDNTTAYATLSAEGALTSGYRNCETNATAPTLRDPYPAGTTLILSPQMIEADINLTQPITMGEHG